MYHQPDDNRNTDSPGMEWPDFSSHKLPQKIAAEEIDWRPQGQSRSVSDEICNEQAAPSTLKEIPLPPPSIPEKEVSKKSIEISELQEESTQVAQATKPKLALSETGKAFIGSFIHELTGLSRHPQDWLVAAGAVMVGGAMLNYFVPFFLSQGISFATIAIGSTLYGAVYTAFARYQKPTFDEEVRHKSSGNSSNVAQAILASNSAWREDMNKYAKACFMAENKEYTCANMTHESARGIAAGGRLAHLLLGATPLGLSLFFRDVAQMGALIASHMVDSLVKYGQKTAEVCKDIFTHDN